MFPTDAVNKPDKETMTYIQMLPFSLFLTLFYLYLSRTHTLPLTPSCHLSSHYLSLFFNFLFFTFSLFEEHVNQQDNEKILEIKRVCFHLFLFLSIPSLFLFLTFFLLLPPLSLFFFFFFSLSLPPLSLCFSISVSLTLSLTHTHILCLSF